MLFCDKPDNARKLRRHAGRIGHNGGMAANEVMEQDRAGRFVGATRLTAQQAIFVERIVDGLSQGKAAEAAGYVYPDQSASALIRQPKIAAAIHAEQARRIGTLANAALRVLAGILNDDSAPVKVRLDAAKTVLDRAGHIAPKAADQQAGAADKPLNEMTVDELEAFIRRGRDAIEQAGKPVIDNAPTPEPAPELLALPSPKD